MWDKYNSGIASNIAVVGKTGIRRKELTLHPEVKTLRRFWVSHKMAADALDKYSLDSGGHALCLLLSAIVDCVGMFQLVYLLLNLCPPASWTTTRFYWAPQLSILTGETHYNRVLCSGRTHVCLLNVFQLPNSCEYGKCKSLLDSPR